MRPKIRLKHVELLQVIDDQTKQTYYGCNQQWYSSWFRRMSGCGPTVATTMMAYVLKRKFDCKEEAIKEMESMFTYITPGWMGVNKLTRFSSGIIRKHPMIPVEFNVEAHDKTHFDQLVDFLYEGLMLDKPIAFLNLHNGYQPALESWHWVLIIGIYYKDTFPYIEFADNGEIKEMDLSAWYLMKRKKAGFMYVVDDQLTG